MDERRPMNISSQLTCCGSEGGLRGRALRDPTAPGAAPPPTDRALADPGEGLFLTSARFLVPFPVLISGAKLGAGASSERGRAWGKRGACPRNRVCAKPPLSPAWGHIPALEELPAAEGTASQGRGPAVEREDARGYVPRAS